MRLGKIEAFSPGLDQLPLRIIVARAYLILSSSSVVLLRIQLLDEFSSLVLIAKDVVMAGNRRRSCLWVLHHFSLLVHAHSNGTPLAPSGLNIIVPRVRAFL